MKNYNTTESLSPVILPETPAVAGVSGSIARLYENLPDKPYCSNHLSSGLKIRPKPTAVTSDYLQLNKPKILRYVVFDVDYSGAAWSWDWVGLPAPTFIVINPENAHAHLIYELNTPVLLWDNARQKPIRFLEAIRRAYTDKLEADAGFVSPVSKNPASNRWLVLHFEVRYDLGDLADWVLLSQQHFIPRRGQREGFASLGRNCYLFFEGRFYAYDVVKHCAILSELYFLVYAYIEAVNVKTFADPLPENERRQITKSISKWTWQHRENFWGYSSRHRRKTKDDEELLARQVQSAHNTAEIKRAATEEKIRRAIDHFLREGRKITKAAIAREVGISRQAIHEYYSPLLEKVST